MQLAGCGGSPPPDRSSAAIADWTEGEHEETRPASRTIAGESGGPVSRSTTIGGPGPTQAVVARGAMVDARFHGAEVREAIRLLAEAARLDVIVDEDVRGTVDLDLREVRPLDAITAIAEAHGATVAVSGRLVIVRPAE
jgi:type II secretory pathway component GspD/PulD (secretin)